MENNYFANIHSPDNFDAWFMMAELDLKILELLYNEVPEEVKMAHASDITAI